MRIQANNPQQLKEIENLEIAPKSTSTDESSLTQQPPAAACTSRMQDIGKDANDKSMNSCNASGSASQSKYMKQLKKNDGGLYFGLHHQTDARIIHEMRTLGIHCEFDTGTLTHRLNFRDVYISQMDRKDGSSEDVGSTFHNKWICVDYIFYRYIASYSLLFCR